jgi:sulfur-carrier protein adenylyltransferase/sulfurtransferase
MKALNDQLKYTAIDCKLSSENAVENFKNYDLVVDATDNFNARYVRDDVKLLSRR